MLTGGSGEGGNTSGDGASPDHPPSEEDEEEEEERKLHTMYELILCYKNLRIFSLILYLSLDLQV